MGQIRNILLFVVMIPKLLEKQVVEWYHNTIEELRLGCKLGLDSWADMGCSEKHAHVEEFVIGKSVTTTGFSSFLGKVDN